MRLEHNPHLADLSRLRGDRLGVICMRLRIVDPSTLEHSGAFSAPL